MAIVLRPLRNRGRVARRDKSLPAFCYGLACGLETLPPVRADGLSFQFLIDLEKVLDFHPHVFRNFLYRSNLIEARIAHRHREDLMIDLRLVD